MLTRHFLGGADAQNYAQKVFEVWNLGSMDALLLLVIGWGSPENGMVLYSLYFSWAFFVLLFLLMDWIAEKGKMKLLVPAVSCVAAAALIVCNYHGMADLLAFATRYYPM